MGEGWRVECKMRAGGFTDKKWDPVSDTAVVKFCQVGLNALALAWFRRALADAAACCSAVLLQPRRHSVPVPRGGKLCLPTLQGAG